MSETAPESAPARLRLSDHIPPASVVGDFAEWLTFGGGLLEVRDAVKALPEAAAASILPPPPELEAGG
jgi:hypothetical protein